MTARLAFAFALASCLSFAAACAEPTSTTAEPAGGKTDSPGQSDPDPDVDAPLHCWDLTFAYNMMTLTPQEDGSIDFVLQGANVDIADYAPNDDGGWHPAEVTFSLPAEACERSSVDPRRIACGDNDVAIKAAVDFEPPVDGTLSYLYLTTTHTVRTDAGDQVTESLELTVSTQTDVERASYTINFPLELDPCTDQPPQ